MIYGPRLFGKKKVAERANTPRTLRANARRGVRAIAFGRNGDAEPGAMDEDGDCGCERMRRIGNACVLNDALVVPDTLRAWRYSREWSRNRFLGFPVQIFSVERAGKLNRTHIERVPVLPPGKTLRRSRARGSRSTETHRIGHLQRTQPKKSVPEMLLLIWNALPVERSCRNSAETIRLPPRKGISVATTHAKPPKQAIPKAGALARPPSQAIPCGKRALQAALPTRRSARVPRR